MRTNCREWLPGGTITAARVSVACASVFSDWQQKWFMRRDRALMLKPGSGAPGKDDRAILFEGKGLRLSLGGMSRQQLRGALIGELPSASEISEADQAVLDQLIQKVVQDLGQALAQGSVEQTEAVCPYHQFDLCCVPGATLMHISISEDAMAILLRKDLPSKRAAFRPASLKDALRNRRVLVSAELGSVEIEMAELKALASGDVIVLDTRVGGTIELRLLNETVRVAAGVLTDVADHNAIKIID